jgi:hypothetical protein
LLDPQLGNHAFSLDEVSSGEILFCRSRLAHIPGAVPVGAGVRFRANKSLSIALKPECDLARFDRLTISVENNSSSDILCGLKFDYYKDPDSRIAAPEAFTGGRELLHPGTRSELKFPIESCGFYGFPQGWEGVEQITIRFGFDKGFQGPDDIEISMFEIRGESRTLRRGPRLTEEGFAAVVNGVPTSMRAGSTLRGSGDAGSSHDLLIPPPHTYHKESAAELIAGRIMGYAFPDGVDWKANPLGVQEWTHFLNRHHFIRRLLAGAYSTRIEEFLSDWIESNPVPVDSNGGAGPAWETLSAAWRLREWLMPAKYAWTDLSDEFKTLALRSVWEHARHLMDHQGHPNNWIIVESAALTMTGLYFPEFKEASSWAQTGLRRLLAAAQKQFYSDGAHFELSPLYHAICLTAILDVIHALRAAQRAVPRELENMAHKAAVFLTCLRRPDGSWPSINDSGSFVGDYRETLCYAAEVLSSHNPSEGASFRKDGSGGLTVFPDAGIAILKSGAGSASHQLIFRAGPAGASHVHNDVLSLDVSVYGSPRLVDAGITGYAPDELTDHYRSAAAHNTFLINGKGPVRSVAEYSDSVENRRDRLEWLEKENCALVSGTYTGGWEAAEQASVRRSVTYFRSDFWLVKDEIDCGAADEITVCWQFAPGRVEIDLATYSARLVDSRGPSFQLIPIPGSGFEVEMFTGALRPPRGWVSLNGVDTPATCLMYHFKPRPRTRVYWLLTGVERLSHLPVEARIITRDGPAFLEMRKRGMWSRHALHDIE